MITVGDKVQFDPFIEDKGFASRDCKGRLVTGTVVMVHRLNEWFSVEYECAGTKLRTSFKFHDIGRAVTVCGHQTNR
jgi:hypothetical protein